MTEICKGLTCDSDHNMSCMGNKYTGITAQKNFSLKIS